MYLLKLYLKTSLYPDECKMTRIQSEKNIVMIMIKLYCQKKHGHKQELCQDCRNLLEYAHERLDNCKFGKKKSSCRKCTVHCYKKDMRKSIREVMGFSGPRMIFYKPFEVVKHFIKQLFI